MNVQQLNVTKEQAAEAVKAHRAARGVYDAQDWEIERIYRAIARGGAVISVADAIYTAGWDEQHRPRLAVCRADSEMCLCRPGGREVLYEPPHGRRWRLRVPWLGMAWMSVLQARVPRIPPQHRPKKLRDYWILWEADWQAIPRDPYLLKRIGKDAWVVVAAWELTDVEVSVLRAHERQ